MTPKISHAQAVPTDYSFDYRFTQYKENEQPANTTSSGETVERYKIDVQQLGIVAPLSSTTSLKFNASTETMTGASPWYVREDTDGNTVQVMSGATIEESRDDLSVSVNFYPGNKNRIGFGLTRSRENDYESDGLNVNSTLWLNDNNTTIDVGFSFSSDTISPTQDPSIDPDRIIEDNKSSEAVTLSFTQVLNKSLIIGAGMTFAEYEGYLSDPYKLAFVDGQVLHDARPDNRSQFSIDFKARKYFSTVAGALHADYRFYDNNWGLDSHTLSLGWYQNLESWQLSTRLRFYDQSEAAFYQNYYTAERPDGYYSSDYRLSAFGAMSYRIGLSKAYDFASFTISYENYNSGEAWRTSDETNPGLVDFSFFTIGFNVKL